MSLTLKLSRSAKYKIVDLLAELRGYGMKLTLQILGAQLKRQ